jgi:hypothetical protein
MSELSDGLEKIAEESSDSSARRQGELVTRRQSELVNLSFTLTNARLVKFVYQGEERQAYVGSVVINGAEEEAYLGGAICMKQIKWLVESAKLPAPLRLVRDSDRFGSPYVLKAAEPAGLVGPDNLNGHSSQAGSLAAAAL